MPDLLRLYSSLHTTWDKVRVDILSHAFLFGVLFLARVKLPSISLPIAGVDELMSLPLYRLAKDTNALLLVPVVLSLAVIVYGLVMRTISQALTGVVIAMFRRTTQDPFIAGAVLVPDLVTIASLLKRSDFSERDLSTMVSSGMRRYRAKQDADTRPFQIGEQDKDAFLYLGYALLFGIGWVMLFLWLPSESAWRTQNSGSFWPVLALLLLFVMRNWIQVREFFFLIPGALVSFVASSMRSDPELKPALDAATSDLVDIVTRVETLRLDALRRAAPPSVIGFLRSRLRNSHSTQPESSLATHTWLRRVYEEGRDFSESRDKTVYDSHWLGSFAKYVFYRITHAAEQLLMLGLVLVLYLTGTNVWLQRVSRSALELSTLELGETTRNMASVNADLARTVGAFAREVGDYSSRISPE